MKLFEVIVRDSNNGKSYIYFIQADSEGSARHLGHVQHSKETGHGCSVIKVTQK